MNHRFNRLARSVALATTLWAAPFASHSQPLGEQPMAAKQKQQEKLDDEFNRDVLPKLDQWATDAQNENWPKGGGIPKDVFKELNQIHSQWVLSGKLQKLSPELQKVYDDYLKTLIDCADAGQKITLNLTPVRKDGPVAVRASNVVSHPKVPGFRDTSGRIVVQPFDFSAAGYFSSGIDEKKRDQFNKLTANFLDAYLKHKGAAKAGAALADFIEGKGAGNEGNNFKGRLGVPPSQADAIIKSLRAGEINLDVSNQLSSELASKLTDAVKTWRVRIPTAVMEASFDLDNLPIARIDGSVLVLRAGALLSAIAYDTAGIAVKGSLEDKNLDVSLDLTGGDLAVQAQGRIGAGLKLTDEHTAYVDFIIERDPLKSNSPAQFTLKMGFSDEKGLKIAGIPVYSDSYLLMKGHIAGQQGFADTMSLTLGTTASMPLVNIGSSPLSLITAVEVDALADSTSISPDLRLKAGVSFEPSPNFVGKLYTLGAVSMRSSALRETSQVGGGFSFMVVNPANLGLLNAAEGGLELTRGTYKLELFDSRSERTVNAFTVFLKGTY